MPTSSNPGFNSRSQTKFHVKLISLNSKYESQHFHQNHQSPHLRKSNHTYFAPINISIASQSSYCSYQRKNLNHFGSTFRRFMVAFAYSNETLLIVVNLE